MPNQQSADHSSFDEEEDRAPRGNRTADDPHAAGPDSPDADGLIVVTVVRSGGFAGLSRRWQASPPPAERPRWSTLIDRCPWNDAPTPESGADRFSWEIDAVNGSDTRTAALTEDDIQGPWRALIDAVRSSGGK